MFITVIKDGSLPLCRQVYAGIREQILAGTLSPGTKMPSSRGLARDLGVSRNVILEAYELLTTEGFTRTSQGSGTFVTAGAVYTPPPSPPPAGVAMINMGYTAPAGLINFRSGTPDLSRFPRKLWANLLRDAALLPGVETLGYGNPEGRPELRKAIRDYVVSHRGVSCHPDQIVVTAGTTQAIGIAARLLLGARREVILEDPITRDIVAILRDLGGIIHPVPVDDQGLCTDRLPQLRAACIYVTPSHQYPVGATLPVQRRVELLRYAEKSGAYIIEDDYDSEFRFNGPPLNSLHGLNPELVIYIGTFSKTLCPALRTGYLVLPPALITRAREQKWHHDLHNGTATQLALAAFIREGHYLRHLGRMKNLYRQRRACTVQALRDTFRERVAILGSATGLHLCARFHGVRFSAHLLAEVERRGARFYPAALHAIATTEYEDTLIVGYGNLDDAEIRKGIALLGEVIG